METLNEVRASLPSYKFLSNAHTAAQYFPPYSAPPATDPITKLQHLLNNSLTVIADILHQTPDHVIRADPSINQVTESTNLEKLALQPDKSKIDESGTQKNKLEDHFSETVLREINFQSERLAQILRCMKEEAERLPSSLGPSGCTINSECETQTAAEKVAAVDAAYAVEIRKLLRENTEAEKEMLEANEIVSQVYETLTDRLKSFMSET